MSFERIDETAQTAFSALAALYMDDESHPAYQRLRELKVMPYSDYLKTPEWEQMRRSMVRAAGFRCQRCSQANTKLDVHHLTYERRGEEAREDLEVICRNCHDEEHGV